MTKKLKNLNKIEKVSATNTSTNFYKPNNLRAVVGKKLEKGFKKVLKIKKPLKKFWWHLGKIIKKKYFRPQKLDKLLKGHSKETKEKLKKKKASKSRSIRYYKSRRKKRTKPSVKLKKYYKSQKKYVYILSKVLQRSFV